MKPVRVLPTQTLMPQQLIGDGDEPFSTVDDFTRSCRREISFVVSSFPQKHGSVKVLDQGQG